MLPAVLKCVKVKNGAWASVALEGTFLTPVCIGHTVFGKQLNLTFQVVYNMKYSGVGSNPMLQGPPIQVVGVALITEFVTTIILL